MCFALSAVKSLLPGQSVQVNLRELEWDFPYRRHNGAVFTPPDNLLESVVGSSYEYGYSVNFMDRTVTFFRLEKPLEQDGVFSYVSPDRRHHYRFDGRLFRSLGHVFQGYVG